jgi:hypothetical protein
MISRSSHCSVLVLSAVGAVIAAQAAAAATIEEQPPPNGCVAIGAGPVAASAAPSPDRLQLEISTRFEPTAFPSAGATT